MGIPKLDSNFTAKLKISETLTKFSRRKNPTKLDPDNSEELFSSYDYEELALAFQELVSLCIIGTSLFLQFDEAKEILITHEYECIDEQTGYNIIEIASISGNVEFMKMLLNIMTDENYFFKLGKSLDYAIINEDYEMTECILECSSPKDDSYPRYGNFIQFFGFTLNISCMKKPIIQILSKHANKNTFTPMKKI